MLEHDHTDKQLQEKFRVCLQYVSCSARVHSHPRVNTYPLREGNKLLGTYAGRKCSYCTAVCVLTPGYEGM